MQHPSRVALISEQYAPDMSSTAQLFEELLHELSERGVETTACAMTPGYVKNVAKAPLREMRKGVRVWRMPRLPFARTNRLGEALNWVWATFCLSWMALWVPRRVPLIVGTNPPMAHIVGGLMKILKGQRFIALFYDLHPELSCAVGVLREGSLIDRMWRRINSWALRRADLALSLGPYMTQSIKARCATVPTLIMHNWCDAKTVRCLPKAESRFAREHDLLDKFVVLFSGNMGWRQRLEILLDVAEKVQDTSIRFVFIGEGAKKAKLQETAQQRGLRNVFFFPYQPRELIEHSLAAADISVVSQEREVIGFGVPSKIYTYMASGRPMLGLAGKDQVNVVSDQFGSPTFVPHLAKAIGDLIETNAFGLYHLSGSGFTSWYELTRTLFRLFDIKTFVNPVSTAEFPRLAPRPGFSALTTLQDPGIVLPHWETGLSEFAAGLK